MSCSAPHSEKLSAISAEAERLYWRILAATDPYGVVPGGAFDLKVRCLPAVDVALVEIENDVEALVAAGLVERWTELDGSVWVYVVNFESFQPYEFLRKRRDRKTPTPPSLSLRTDRQDGPPVRSPGSTSTERDVVGNEKGIVPRVREEADDASEKEGIGKADVVAVFDEWVSLTWKGRGPRPKLSPKRRTRIAARLKEGFSVDQLKDALRGYAGDAWWRDNDKLDIVYRLGNAENVERGLRLHAKRAPVEDPNRTKYDTTTAVDLVPVAGKVADDDLPF